VRRLSRRFLGDKESYIKKCKQCLEKRWKMVILGHFCPLCNKLSPILMYKYVKGFWVERGSRMTYEKFLVLFWVSESSEGRSLRYD
jgi:hypothetical protein